MEIYPSAGRGYTEWAPLSGLLKVDPLVGDFGAASSSQFLNTF